MEYTNKQLINLAQKAKENSYSPYSNFAVGAVVLAGSGKVYMGANIENASFPAGCCAERGAIFSALSNGEKVLEKLIVVASDDKVVYPCGVCRQVILEHMKNGIIVCVKNENEYEEYKISDLLPHSFDLKK